jgi:hypothetical protein
MRVSEGSRPGSRSWSPERMVLWDWAAGQYSIGHALHPVSRSRININTAVAPSDSAVCFQIRASGMGGCRSGSGYGPSVRPDVRAVAVLRHTVANYPCKQPCLSKLDQRHDRMARWDDRKVEIVHVCACSL